jgi:hypothetical protein
MQTTVQACYFIGILAKTAVGTHRIPRL